MPIFLNPNYNPTSAKRPVQWTVTVNSALNIQKAFANLSINGSAATLTPVYKDPDANSVPPLYYFTFDFQQLVADALAPNSTELSMGFGDGTLNVPYSALTTDVYCEVKADFEYLYRDSTTNQLVNLGIVDTTSSYYALAATRQQAQPMDFDDYQPIFNSQNQWLTDAPVQQDICEDENLYLSYLVANAGDKIKVTSYDSSGIQLETGTFNVAVSPTTQVRTIGVGMANLRTQVYGTGAVNIDNPAMAYYTVDLVGLLLTPYLRTMRFNKVACCNDRSIRLHFLNNYGVADAFTFDSKRKDMTDAKANTAIRPLAWDASAPAGPHNIYNKGAFKIQNTAAKMYELESKWLTKTEAEWLSQLLYSPEVYIETVNGFLPVVITDQTQPTYDSTKTAQSFTITIVEANEIITLQN